MSVRSLKHTAEVALSGYKRQGYGADPKDPDHIAAYVTMRQVCARITPAAFIQHLQSQVKDIGAGATFCTHFWAVPKASWPGGLPPAAAEALVPDDQLDDMELRGGGTVDSDAFYIVDQVVPRESLGNNVHTLELYVMNSTRVRQPPAGGINLVLPATAHGDRAGAAGSGGGDGGGALVALADTAHGGRQPRCRATSHGQSPSARGG